MGRTETARVFPSFIFFSYVFVYDLYHLCQLIFSCAIGVGVKRTEIKVAGPKKRRRKIKREKKGRHRGSYEGSCLKILTNTVGAMYDEQNTQVN
ncbi:hypothetical protein LZ31DRAFT_285138 [Colletotrichum somersetense]|nr:hypothetical protein LZ31DRAFT_285138 [Colletotrichum somersetense]